MPILSRIWFQHTAARRRLECGKAAFQVAVMFQHTAARRRLAFHMEIILIRQWVSTHSRPKAAGLTGLLLLWRHYRFNTPPPEGGWQGKTVHFQSYEMFQHTAARRRLGFDFCRVVLDTVFQHTAARRRLAPITRPIRSMACCFNTQPPEGGWAIIKASARLGLGFNTQPPEGGWALSIVSDNKEITVSTHSRPKAAGQYRLVLIG